MLLPDFAADWTKPHLGRSYDWNFKYLSCLCYSSYVAYHSRGIVEIRHSLLMHVALEEDRLSRIQSGLQSLCHLLFYF